MYASCFNPMLLLLCITETLDFIRAPSPSSVVVALGSEYTYYCNHSQTIRIFWKLNGVMIDGLPLPTGINSAINSVPGGGQVYTLTVGGLPLYNESRFQCVASTVSGASVETPNSTFIIQGQ